MSNTKWRLAGGAGAEALQGQQVMTQGLGFPLRPVADVPPQDSGLQFEDIPIVEGNFMQWVGAFDQGRVYAIGSVSKEGDWTMVANKLTIDSPAPQPDGNPTWGIPTFTPIDQSNLSIVYSGQLYEFTEGVWIKELRIWVSEILASTEYRIVLVDITDPDTPVTQIITDPGLVAGAWTTIAFINAVFGVGTRLLVYIDAVNTAANTTFSGGWSRSQNDNNVVDPGLSQWSRNVQATRLKINKVDLDSTDRGTELLGVTVNSTIQFVDTLNSQLSITYSVTTDPPFDGGTFVEYNVVLTSQGPQGEPAVGSVTTMTAIVPVPLDTEYAEEAAFWPGNQPAWGTVTGYLQFDGVDQGGDDNAYGVDILVEPAIISPDWDLLAYGGV